MVNSRCTGTSWWYIADCMLIANQQQRLQSLSQLLDGCAGDLSISAAFLWGVPSGRHQLGKRPCERHGFENCGRSQFIVQGPVDGLIIIFSLSQRFGSGSWCDGIPTASHLNSRSAIWFPSWWARNGMWNSLVDHRQTKQVVANASFVAYEKQSEPYMINYQCQPRLTYDWITPTVGQTNEPLKHHERTLLHREWSTHWEW